MRENQDSWQIVAQKAMLVENKRQGSINLDGIPEILAEI